MFGRLVVWVLPHARLPEGMVTAYETCPRACAHRCHNRKYCFGGNLLCNLLRNLLRLRFGWAEGLRPKSLLSVICYTICYPIANQKICAEAAIMLDYNSGVCVCLDINGRLAILKNFFRACHLGYGYRFLAWQAWGHFGCKEVCCKWLPMHQV